MTIDLMKKDGGKEIALAIQAQNISKSFKERQVLKNIAFSVEKQSVFAILGPNGAGKTTLLRILTTILNAETGNLKILGLSVPEKTLTIRGKIGIVAQENRFDRYLNIWENLTLDARMYGIPRPIYEPRIATLLKMIGLYERRFDLTDTLSGGMERRVALIRALIHEPEILFLDEPTTGLDPQARQEIWHWIRRYKEKCTVILTTHYMDEADSLSDKIMMLHEGQVVMIGTPRELKQAISPEDRYWFEFREPKASYYAEKLAQLGGYGISQPDAFRLECSLPTPALLRQILETIDLCEIQNFGRLEADLETVFMSIANGSSAAVQASVTSHGLDTSSATPRKLEK